MQGMSLHSCWLLAPLLERSCKGCLYKVRGFASLASADEVLPILAFPAAQPGEMLLCISACPCLC